MIDVSAADMMQLAFAGIELPDGTLGDRAFWQRIVDDGLDCAVAQANGEAAEGVCPPAPTEPFGAKLAVDGFEGQIRSTGRLRMSVDAAELQLDNYFIVDAKGSVDGDGNPIPAASLDLNPAAGPDAPIVTLSNVSASIPAIEALPTIGLESLLVTRSGIELGPVSLTEEMVDFGFITAEDVTLTLPAQSLDYSNPSIIPNLDQISFETGKVVLLPDESGKGVAEFDEGLTLLYRNGQFLATPPSFELEFGPFKSTLENATFFLSGGNLNDSFGRVRVEQASVALAGANEGSIELTATNLRVLSRLDFDGLPQVRFDSISIGSDIGIATTLGLGDFLPFDLTELSFKAGSDANDQTELFELTAVGKFNIDLLAERVDFDPYLILRESDSEELLPLPPGGDGRISSNDDVDNVFEVTLLLDDDGLRLKELPGRVGLGIDNFEVGPFVFEGEIYLGQFVDGLMPSEFGGFLQIDVTPPENEDRVELRSLTSDEKLKEDEKPRRSKNCRRKF
ncbi:MAG: hypothetical protein R3C05_08650 [Pirellulaceae bacterium]